jgi:hypothetical protein
VGEGREGVGRASRIERTAITVYGKRCFGPGDVLFAEDLTGEGHANRELPGPREGLMLPVPDDFDIQRWAKNRA